MDYSDEPRDCSYDEPRFFEPTLHISDPEPPCPIDHWVDDPEPTHCPCCEEADCPSKREIENHYDCDSCGHEWEMTWCCGCDDECPECGTDMSPWESIDLGPPEDDPIPPEGWGRDWIGGAEGFVAAG